MPIDFNKPPQLSISTLVNHFAPGNAQDRTRDREILFEALRMLTLWASQQSKFLRELASSPIFDESIVIEDVKALYL